MKKGSKEQYKLAEPTQRWIIDWSEKTRDISNVTHSCPGSTVTSYSYTTATKLASNK